MKLFGSIGSALCLGLIPLAMLVGCSSDDDNGGTSYAGASGSAGSAGEAGEAGSAGESGEAGSAGNAGEAGEGGSSGAAGESGSSGEAGSAGSSNGTAPTTCESAHGGIGCCEGSTLHYFNYNTSKIDTIDCAAEGLTCGWIVDEEDEYYDCTQKASADPSGTFPLTCGGSVAVEGLCDFGGDDESCAGQPASSLACSSKTPVGNTCASAIDITATGKYTGETTGVGTDEGSCAGGAPESGEVCGNAPEVYFKYTVTKPSKISVSLTTDGDIDEQTSVCDAPLDAVVYIRTSCDKSASEVACNDSATYDTAATTANITAPGDVFIVVDGFMGDIGKFTISVKATDLLSVAARSLPRAHA